MLSPEPDVLTYPPDWPEISNSVRLRAQGRCECGGECRRHTGRCPALAGRPHPDTGARVVFTLARLDRDPGSCDPANLRAMCHPCHVAHDKARPTTTPAPVPTGQLALLDLAEV